MHTSSALARFNIILSGFFLQYTLQFVPGNKPAHREQRARAICFGASWSPLPALYVSCSLWLSLDEPCFGAAVSFFMRLGRYESPAVCIHCTADACLSPRNLIPTHAPLLYRRMSFPQNSYEQLGVVSVSPSAAADVSVVRCVLKRMLAEHKLAVEDTGSCQHLSLAAEGRYSLQSTNNHTGSKVLCGLLCGNELRTYTAKCECGVSLRLQLCRQATPSGEGVCMLLFACHHA